MKVKNIGIILYMLYLLGIMSIQSDNFPGSSILVKFRYLYMIFLVGYFVIYRPIINKRLLYFILLTFVHTILFGYIWVNPDVMEMTHSHAKEMLLLYFIIFATAQYIHCNRMLKQFTLATFLAMMTFILWSYVTHRSGFAPIRYLFQIRGILNDTISYGFTYGLESYNLTGSILTVTIWLFSMVIILFQKDGKLLFFNRRLTFVSVAMVYAYLFLVLVSTTSRGELLSLFVGCFYIIIMFLRKSVRKKDLKVLFDMVLVLSSIFFLYYLLHMTMFSNGANRIQNWEINWEIFQKIGRYYTGMGYVNPWGFLMRYFPGYETFACDVYWYYLFFTTGIIGCIIMGSIIIPLFFCVIKKRHSFSAWYDLIIKAMVPMLIFNNFFHSTIFSYNYTTSVVIFIFLFEYVMEREELNLFFMPQAVDEYGDDAARSNV